jgi:hypothetical protein
MDRRPKIGMMLYGADGVDKSVFTEEKYKALAECFVQSGVSVENVLYNNTRAESLRNALIDLDALLVWVNPIEQGEDRSLLDKLLADLQEDGIFVSSAPETILKIGTKKVLFDTRKMEWGSDIEMYSNFDEFKMGFPDSFSDGKPRVLKQFRGAGGDGVFKVWTVGTGKVSVIHAKRGSSQETKTFDSFYDEFLRYFNTGGPMLNQEWNSNITNGMVRCYMTCKRVVGFGFQEINALFPAPDGPIAPGKRFYLTENCALFTDLREKMECQWIDELTNVVGLSPDKLPVIWDADFFINSMQPNSVGRYTLCEINVSSVSPFPESAIPVIVAEVNRIVKTRL